MHSIESVSNSSLYGSAKCSFFCFYNLDFCTQFSHFFSIFIYQIKLKIEQKESY